MAEIKELKRALIDERLERQRAEMHEAAYKKLVELTEEVYNIPVKKNFNIE